MEASRRTRPVRVVATVLAAGLLSLALFAQEAAPTRRGEANLEMGERLYGIHCQRCHGADGDDINCMDMVPLAGLGRRPQVNLVKRALSPSYFMRGVFYEGAEARALSAYLLTLKGEKGFDDPGLRCIPRLVSRRYGLLNYYRVVDLRDGTAYAKGHIPNAANWPAVEKHAEFQLCTPRVVAEKLGSLAIQPAMSIVIYDDAVTPAAACLWWDIVRVGHQNVAILDGGFRRWVEEGNFVTPVVTPLVPTAYAPAVAPEVEPVRAGRDYPVLHLRGRTPQPSLRVFDWERTVADGQLRTAAEIREYLERSEVRFPGTYRVEGSDAEASFLVYLLRLLGYSGAYYDAPSKLLIADKSNPHQPEPGTP